MRKLFFLVFTTLLAAQSDAPPVFRSTTRLIQVNVVVHDKHGEPVADLKKEDFVLLEKGKPQQISFFAVDKQGAAGPAVELKPNVFSNVVKNQSSVLPPRLLPILLDGLNTSWADQANARGIQVQQSASASCSPRTVLEFMCSAEGLRASCTTTRRTPVSWKSISRKFKW